MTILIEKSGILTTLQDLGRRGYRRFGINPGGVMDRAAARLINILLGNDEYEAVLEMHFPAAQVYFESNAVFAVGGGDLSPILNDVPIENWRPHFAKKGARLKFVNRSSGNRAYFVVKGGFRSKKWLGSTSTNLSAKIGGHDGRPLTPGDRFASNLRIKAPKVFTAAAVSPSIIPRYSSFPTVRVIPGAEYKKLSIAGADLLVDQDFTISNNSNRMGFRLTGEPLDLSKPLELISSAVDFGTVQLLPDGQLIVLMADQQTTGGYPRIAHVVTRDLPLLAQLGANDKVAFHMIDIARSEDLNAEFERDLRFFSVGCKLRANSWTI